MFLNNDIKTVEKITGYKITEEKWFSTDGKNYEPSGVYTYKGYKNLEILENKKAFKHSNHIKEYLMERIMDTQYGFKTHLGGMIVFATTVNAVVDNEKNVSKFIKGVKKAYYSTMNYIKLNSKLNGLVKQLNKEFGNLNYQIGAFTVGKGFVGRYIAEDGTKYDDKSFTIEFGGVPSVLLLLFATRLCQEFKQESVMVKDYNKNKIYLVDGSTFDGNTPDKTISNGKEELKKLDDINVDIDL